MRVLHVYSGNLYGGVEALLVTLARERALCPRMVPSFALCFEGRAAEELRAAGAELSLLGAVRFRQPLSVLRARRALARRLARERPDVVVCHSAWSQALFASTVRRAGARQVFYLHDVSNGSHWLERLARLRPPDAVVCNSRFTAGSVPRLFPHLPAGAIRAVHLPVPAPASGVDPLDPEKALALRLGVREELGTPLGSRVVVVACRMQPWKGHGLLIDALARLCRRPDWEAWVAGGAQRAEERAYEAGLRRQVEAAGLTGRIRFLGQRRDVPRLFAAADVHCQPNASPEPFGIAFVEALHAGLPVVTTAQGGALEIVTPEVGRLVPPGDGAALAEALAEALDLPEDARASRRRAAIARARELCDPEARMSELAEALGGASPSASRRMAS